MCISDCLNTYEMIIWFDSIWFDFILIHIDGKKRETEREMKKNIGKEYKGFDIIFIILSAK